ncbi:MAG: nitrogenase-stabilizing/protective protein NifW [Methylohalobius sp.]
MNPVLLRLQKLSAAEEFFEFFGIAYQPQVVHVNRLHILKRFHQYLKRDPIPDELDEELAFAKLKGYLIRAYQDFVTSTAAREKVFKVFQTKGVEVPLESLKQSLKAKNRR